MIKFWTKLVSDNRIVASFVLERKKFSKDNLHDDLSEICTKLDVPTPIVLNKHVNNFLEYNSCTFLPDDFVEPVSFDKMVIELF